MVPIRIALANLPIPVTREAAVDAAVAAIAEAGRQGALIALLPRVLHPRLSLAGGFDAGA